MNSSANSNIFELGASRAIDRYKGSLSATPQCVFLAIGSADPSDGARQAIVSTAERFGLGPSNVGWLQLADLESDDLANIIFGVDPLSMVFLDAESFAVGRQVFKRTNGIPESADVAFIWNGKSCVAFDSFEEMLGSEDGKQRAWRFLKTLQAPFDISD